MNMPHWICCETGNNKHALWIFNCGARSIMKTNTPAQHQNIHCPAAAAKHYCSIPQTQNSLAPRERERESSRWSMDLFAARGWVAVPHYGVTSVACNIYYWQNCYSIHINTCSHCTSEMPHCFSLAPAAAFSLAPSERPGDCDYVRALRSRQDVCPQWAPRRAAHSRPPTHARATRAPQAKSECGCDDHSRACPGPVAPGDYIQMRLFRFLTSIYCCCCCFWARIDAIVPRSPGPWPAGEMQIGCWATPFAAISLAVVVSRCLNIFSCSVILHIHRSA
jgi:hypothetical protein